MTAISTGCRTITLSNQLLETNVLLIMFLLLLLENEFDISTHAIRHPLSEEVWRHLPNIAQLVRLTFKRLKSLAPQASRCKRVEINSILLNCCITLKMSMIINTLLLNLYFGKFAAKFGLADWTLWLNSDSWRCNSTLCPWEKVTKSKRVLGKELLIISNEAKRF